MLLKIEETTTIDKINSELHKKFPHIKLVFFKNHGGGTPDDVHTRVTELYKPLSSIFGNMRNAHININGNLQARSLELKIEELTGLKVQVFRRSGKLWLETLNTDNKTLAELSRLASESLEDDNNTEIIDYQEQE